MPEVEMSPNTEMEVRPGVYTTFGKWLEDREKQEAKDWARKVAEEIFIPGEKIQYTLVSILEEIHKEIRRQVKNRHSY